MHTVCAPPCCYRPQIIATGGTRACDFHNLLFCDSFGMRACVRAWAMVGGLRLIIGSIHVWGF